MSRAVRQFPLTVLALAIAAGCAEDNTLKDRLANIQAQRAADLQPGANSLELRLANGSTSWCPSAMRPVQLMAALKTGGTVRHTHVRGTPDDRDLPYTTVNVKMNTGSVGPEWDLFPPQQPLTLLDRTIEIEGQVANHPDVRARLALTPTFDCDQAGAFPGRPGRPGGTGGGRGENGETGLSVVAMVGYFKTARGEPMVFVKAVPSEGVPAYFVLARGRHLGIDVRGGAGGPGGSGYVSGVQFSGGLGGDGGNGGQVEVHYDAHNPELREVVMVASAGGKGGEGGEGPNGAKGYAGRPGRPGAPAKYLADESEKMFKDEIEQGLSIAAGKPRGQL
jgi:hypothetical protein